MKFKFNNIVVEDMARRYLEDTNDTKQERFLFIALLAKKDLLFAAVRRGVNYEENMGKLIKVQEAITDKLEGGTRWKEA